MLGEGAEGAGPEGPPGDPKETWCDPSRLAAPGIRLFSWVAWWEPGQGRFRDAPWEDGRLREADPASSVCRAPSR